MARVEERHWWYRGLRDILKRTLRNGKSAMPAHPRVLDAGCGTGRNLAALREWFEPSYIGGFDTSPEALQLARQRVPGADLYHSDICAPTLHEGDFDLVVSLDVIYIPGAECARPGLAQIVEALRPGGRLVLNLPAYEWLFSEHDVAIHTSERYTARRILSLLDDLGLQVQLLTYRLCLLFPLVVAVRLPSLFRPRSSDETALSDLHSVPSDAANRALFAALRAENALIAGGVRFPFGSSVYVIAQKR